MLNKPIPNQELASDDGGVEPDVPGMSGATSQSPNPGHAAYMVAPMVALMILARHMFRSEGANVALIAASIAVFFVCFR